MIDQIIFVLNAYKKHRASGKSDELFGENLKTLLLEGQIESDVYKHVINILQNRHTHTLNTGVELYQKIVTPDKGDCRGPTTSYVRYVEGSCSGPSRSSC